MVEKDYIFKEKSAVFFETIHTPLTVVLFDDDDDDDDDEINSVRKDGCEKLYIKQIHLLPKSHIRT